MFFFLVFYFIYLCICERLSKKLPRCLRKDREGFTEFALRELTVDPNRKVSAKWKEIASEPRCVFSEKIQCGYINFSRKSVPQSSEAGLQL